MKHEQNSLMIHLYSQLLRWWTLRDQKSLEMDFLDALLSSWRSYLLIVMLDSRIVGGKNCIGHSFIEFLHFRLSDSE